MKPRLFLQAAGLSTLYVAPYASDFLTPTLGDAYHRIHPLTSIYRAILIATLLIWIVALISFELVERISPRWRRVVWFFPSILLIWLFFRGMAGAFAAWPNIALLALHVEHYLAPAAVLIGIGLLFFFPNVFDRCIEGVRISYAVCGFGLLVIVPQLTYHAFPSEPRELTSFERANLPAVLPSEPRIVWILMDELSYDQVFASRQPDVLLPNFDLLAKSSTTFSALEPVGVDTEKVLPSLIWGTPVDALRKPYASLPSYRSTAGGSWQDFRESDTIFADAQLLGWTTGIAGWYNPYCRLLSHVLDRCSWQYSEPGRADLSGALSSTNSVRANLLAMLPFRGRIDAFMHRPIADRTDPHRGDYLGVMAQAEDIVRDSRIRFVFVHLPVPHPPGIFNRKLDTFSTQGSYLDNLVLADESLGRLLGILQTTPAAANTILIVSSDHSWRTFFWQGTADWTAEGEQATHGGKFDPRPVLMIHLPNNDAAEVISKPVSVLVLHQILDNMLRGGIHTSADLENFIDLQPQERVDAQK